MNKKQVQHITADVPADLVKQVDERAELLGVTRSFAVRKGLALFLQTHRQELTENVNASDNPDKVPANAHR